MLLHEIIDSQTIIRQKDIIMFPGCQMVRYPDCGMQISDCGLNCMEGRISI
ncbi:hypothetical protein D1AOALGA4SA_4512 [Olavius algarvensis Delta 1 endosymbiont]|nr:hypothetical protein D1AOALGA4SA_4512 [Olavius algarvensis Delta 1 endosymbiont]